MLQRILNLAAPIDIVGTLTKARRGPHDPLLRISHREIWWATRTAEGSATLRLDLGSAELEASAWGPGAAAVLETVPDLIGLDDDHHAFRPDHPVVRRWVQDHPGIRVPRTRAVYETLVASILEQRVTMFEARRAQEQVIERWGEPAPGPGPRELHLPPDPKILAGAAPYDLHVMGVEQERADTIRRVAANATFLDGLADLPLAEANAHLREFPGVGPWSAAEVSLLALGDADAVPLGDAHLPAAVTFALTGRAVDDDDAMLEALEPFSGHRARVLLLMEAAGVRAPERGPRYAPRDLHGT